MAKKKWGKIGAPNSPKRKAWMKKIRKMAFNYKTPRRKR